MLDLKDRLKDVEVKFTENEKKVEGATKEADEAERLADEAEKVSRQCFSSLEFNAKFDDNDYDMNNLNCISQEFC